MTVVKIDNNTSAMIYLFATPSFPKGIRLVPGLNTVPQAYMDEFLGRAVQPEGRSTKTRNPGAEQLKALQTPVTIITVDGVRFGPQITVYTDDQAGRQDGPPPPVDLRGFKLDQALALIRVTSDRKALGRWSKDARSEVASAAASRLSSISSNEA